MNRLLVLLAICWLVLPSPAVCGDEVRRAALSAQLAVDSRLLTETLRSYGEARAKQKSTLAALVEVESEQDQTLLSTSATPSQVASAEQEREVSAAAYQVTAARSQGLRERLMLLYERIAATRTELAQLGNVAIVAGDPISGRWEIEISSPPQRGTFELRLEGAQVTGTFRLDNGRSGSLSGTLAGGRLRLLRTDANRGFDGLFEGTVDPALGTVRGFYSPANLAAGEPAGSGWSGVKKSSQVSAGETESGEGS